MSNVIKVGIADMDIAVSPQFIRTVGLGSCVGVVVYDSRLKMAAMAHIMLPDSRLAKGEAVNAAKFADLGVKALVDLLKSKGSSGNGLKAKMAGGAQMFQFAEMTEITRIGSRNVAAIERQLARFRIKKVAADVGGNCGRTIEFDSRNETLTIRTVYRGISEI